MESAAAFIPHGEEKDHVITVGRCAEVNVSAVGAAVPFSEERNHIVTVNAAAVSVMCITGA